MHTAMKKVRFNMVLVYLVNGQMVSVCELDKSRYMGLDIRDWFYVDDDKLVITKKVSRGIERFELRNLCLTYERNSQTQLEEL